MSYCQALEASTVSGKEDHAAVTPDARGEAGKSAGAAATVPRKAGHSADGSGALLCEAGRAAGAHQLLTAAAAAEAAPAASAATVAANTAAVVDAAARRSSTAGAAYTWRWDI